MSEELIIGLSSIVALGVSAQWLAWRTKLPAILVLLIFGIVAGPVTGFINPDHIFGDLLSPFVSISVAIILFEGGLSLRFSELREIGGVVVNLITTGIIITWVLASISAYYLLGIGLEVSVLFGAILIVTGPTVIIPLLRQIRPTETIGSVLRWEGIVNDPIGAMMAVLVFEIILSGGFASITGSAALSIVNTIVFGTFFGGIGALILWFMLKKHLIPDYLQNPISLMIVISMFALSNLMQHESGLWAVTVMGIALANQKSVRLKHIVEFKENLQVLLISALFIMLASRLTTEDIGYFNLKSLGFMIALLFVVRPAAAYISTIGSKLSLKERTFLAWMAPRGIVAAAISAIFALRLEENGIEGAELLVPYTFIVIISTVTIYGLSANPMAKILKVAKPKPKGIMMVGAHTWARDIAIALHGLGFKVVLADSNWENISTARKAGLHTYYGNILSEYAIDDIDLDGVGRMIALTPNDEVNSLAAIRFAESLGSSMVYKLAPIMRSSRRDNDKPDSLAGRTLFNSDMSFDFINDKISAGANIIVKELTPEYTPKDYEAEFGERATSLFLVTSDKFVIPFSTDNPPSPQVNETLISLVIPDLGEDKTPVFEENEDTE